MIAREVKIGDFRINPYLVEDCGFAVHLLDANSNVADGDVAVEEEAGCRLPLSVHHVPKLDVLIPKLLLILLQPALQHQSSSLQYIRVSQNAPFSVKHSMTGGKGKLE